MLLYPALPRRPGCFWSIVQDAAAPSSWSNADILIEAGAPQLARTRKGGPGQPRPPPALLADCGNARVQCNLRRCTRAAASTAAAAPRAASTGRRRARAASRTGPGRAAAVAASAASAAERASLSRGFTKLSMFLNWHLTTTVAVFALLRLLVGVCSLYHSSSTMYSWPLYWSFWFCNFFLISGWVWERFETQNMKICCSELWPYLKGRNAHKLSTNMHVGRWLNHSFRSKAATPAIQSTTVRNQQNSLILLNIALTFIAQTDKLLLFLQSDIKFGCPLERNINVIHQNPFEPPMILTIS